MNIDETKAKNNASHPKNNTISVSTLVLITHDSSGEYRELIKAYAYRSPGGSVVRANIWIGDELNNLYVSGKGSAAGGGYCKMSAAFGEALTSCGVTLDNGVCERGVPVVKKALKQIAEYQGYTDFYVVEL